MQKIIFILVTLLLTTIGHAKFSKAVLYMVDGSKKKVMPKWSNLMI